MRAVLVFGITICLASGCSAERKTGKPARRARVESPAVAHSLPPPVSSAREAAEAREDCPADPYDARIGTETVEYGAALVFTTSENVADLRQRVATLELPPAMRDADSRLDNIYKGVRRVFESSAAENVNSLRQTVTAHARQMAIECGLSLVPAERLRTEAARSAKPATAVTVRVPEPAKSKQSQTPQKKTSSQPDSKAAPPKPKSAPSAGTKHQVEKKPSTSSPDRFKPKDKPRLPPLPGVRPEPILRAPEAAPSGAPWPREEIEHAGLSD
jgi:hypothetical protein